MSGTLKPLMLNAGGDGVEIANSLPSASGISLCEDILFLIFSNFDTSNAADKGDCARCARVCSLWSEPALRTLWRSLKYALLPLYWILLPEPTSAWIKRRHSSATEALDSFFQTLGFVAPQEQSELLEYFSKILRQAPFSDAATWQRFLRYAAYVQHLEHWQGLKGQEPLLHALLVWNGWKTFLPHLRSLTWLETPHHDEILALLVSPSLTTLELRVHTETSIGQAEKTIEALSSTAHFLSCLRIYNNNKSGHLKPPMSGFQHLRSLIIDDDMTCPDLTTLAPRCRQTLEKLRYHPEGFAPPLDDITITRCLGLPNLRDLELFGPPTNRMCAFIAYLRAPLVDVLDLELRDENGKPANSLPAQTALFRTVSGASFAPSLSRLSIAVQTKASLGEGPGAGPPTVMSAVSALFCLPALRVVSVAYYCPDATLGTDADMLAAATAWRDLENLSFDFPFSEAYDVGGFPGLPALGHFAAHCPRLVRLRTPLALVRPPPEPESEAAHSSSQHSGGMGERLPVPSELHPMRTLEVQVRQWDSGVEPEAVGRRIDELFPNLGTDELRFRYPIRPRMPPRRYQGRWDLMITAWNQLRAARRGNV